MIISNFKRLCALSALLFLAGCLPAPATGELRTTPSPEEAAYNADLAQFKRAEQAALNVGTKNIPAQGRLRDAGLGEIGMRSVAQRLDRISLWRDEADKNPVSSTIWDGAKPQDVAVILPSLIGSKHEEVKKITLRIAMSAVYTPEGPENTDAMDYVRWRAAVLAADKKYTQAARLLNVVRIGRDSGTDLVMRIAYELASEQPEAACVESMAAGHAGDTPFWQGMQALCAWQMGDASAARQAATAIADDEIKAAAEKLNGGNPKPLIAALVNGSGALPVAQPLPDNKDMIDRLKSLLSDIKDADDSAAALKDKQGEVLLLALGSLAAENRGDDTQSVTHDALKLVGF